LNEIGMCPRRRYSYVFVPPQIHYSDTST